jgi:hypothetical protein
VVESDGRKYLKGGPLVVEEGLLGVRRKKGGRWVRCVGGCERVEERAEKKESEKGRSEEWRRGGKVAKGPKRELGRAKCKERKEGRKEGSGNERKEQGKRKERRNEDQRNH